jgi:hypothetical protein
VIFEKDMRLVEVVMIPVDVVREYMGWSSTWQANRLTITQKLLADHRLTRLPADALVGRAAHADDA